jgi:hypothetical protein
MGFGYVDFRSNGNFCLSVLWASGPKTIQSLQSIETIFLSPPLPFAVLHKARLLPATAPTKAMALWYRVGSNRLRPITLLFYSRLSVIPATSPHPVAASSSKPPPVYTAPSLPFIQFRSFAAPVQVISSF